MSQMAAIHSSTLEIWITQVGIDSAFINKDLNTGSRSRVSALIDEMEGSDLRQIIWINPQVS
jgi:hypothetical protein